MGLALGADCCRYVTGSNASTVHREPAIVWRRANDGRVLLGGKSVGQGAAHTLICKNREAYELCHPFAADVQPDRDLLAVILRYFRERAADLSDAGKPRRLLLTGRADLQATLAAALPSAAREAGLRDVRWYAEEACIAAAAGVRSDEAVVLADVGHTGTRVWGWHEGGPLPEADATSLVGGRRMQQAVLTMLADRHGLKIGDQTAFRILIAHDAQSERTVKGRDMDTGRPRKTTVEPDALDAVLAPLFAEISDLCRRAAEGLSAASATPSRVVLAGGASEFEALLTRLQADLSLPVELRPDPGSLSASGLAQAPAHAAAGNQCA